VLLRRPRNRLEQNRVAASVKEKEWTVKNIELCEERSKVTKLEAIVKVLKELLARQKLIRSFRKS